MSRIDSRASIEPIGVRKANNAGLVLIVAAGVPALLHTMPTSMPTTAKIRKVVAYNGAGVATLLQIGYVTLAAAWVQTLPSLLCLAGFENIWNEADLANYEFRPDTTLVTGTLGDIMAQISAFVAGQVQVRLEVEEIRQ